MSGATGGGGGIIGADKQALEDSISAGTDTPENNCSGASTERNSASQVLPGTVAGDTSIIMCKENKDVVDDGPRSDVEAGDSLPQTVASSRSEDQQSTSVVALTASATQQVNVEVSCNSGDTEHSNSNGDGGDESGGQGNGDGAENGGNGGGNESSGGGGGGVSVVDGNSIVGDGSAGDGCGDGVSGDGGVNGADVDGNGDGGVSGADVCSNGVSGADVGSDGINGGGSDGVNGDGKDGVVGEGQQSSTFNTALAIALNIQPKKAPPAGGLLTGNLELKLEEPSLRAVDTEEFVQYCEKRFEFKTIKIIRNLSWRQRRRLERVKQKYKSNITPLPKGLKLLSLSTQDSADSALPARKKRWLMNPKGKSSICILHEYIQYVLKHQPIYVFKEMDNSSSPYAAAVYVEDMEYATGYGSSKKQAKADAAQKTLEILMPELGHKLRKEVGKEEDEDLSFFDTINIEDPNVAELCNKVSEIPPYAILLNCLKRNFCLDDTNIECQLVTKKNQKNEFRMTVGKHSVNVICRNKKEGKQRASQALLQKLHPQITSWSSMLRLYGNRSLQQQRQKKMDEQEVTLLQSNATVNQPNFSIINMLKQEMIKLHDEKVSLYCCYARKLLSALSK